MKFKSIVSGLVAAGLGIAVTAGVAQADWSFFKHTDKAAAAAPAAAASAAAPVATVALPDFSSLVDKYGPAVVNISVTGTMKTNTQIPQFPGMDPDDPFWQFFRRFQPIPRGEQPVRGLGSGFIVSPEGIILTNAHVVDGADEVTVKLTDKREFKAKVVGVDKQSDVAVLKIPASNLPTVKLGDSACVRVGNGSSPSARPTASRTP